MRGNGNNPPPARDLLNSSGQDYFEREQRQCRCGNSFESKRLVWGGKPGTPYSPDVCPDCEPFQNCTPLILPNFKNNKPPQPCSRVESTEQSRELAPLVLAQYRDLCALAYTGDDYAVRVIVEITKSLVGVLQRLAHADPKRLIPLAEQDIVWPAFISTKKRASEKLNQFLLKTLQVGKKSPHRGKWHTDSKASAAASYLHHWLQANQQTLGLPPLTKTTIETWFDKGWKAIMLFTDQKPEQDELLSAIGCSGLGKGKNAPGKANRGMPDLTPGMEACDVRSKIRFYLHKAFLTLNSGLYS